jgi:N-acetylneuraminic acid mutarotase
MIHARTGHSATLLPDGQVLVAGGNTAELFDPATGTWTATGALPESFFGHSATLLPNGTVLIAGGDVPSGPGARGWVHAALFDPATGRWTVTGSMVVGRLNHTATLLPDGRVLVLGGQSDGGEDFEVFADAEVYDPSSEAWAAVVDMGDARAGHSATLLFDGRVLAAGGTDHPSAELYVGVGD